MTRHGAGQLYGSFKNSETTWIGSTNIPYLSERRKEKKIVTWMDIFVHKEEIVMRGFLQKLRSK
jgi:hypothetical protein